MSICIPLILSIGITITITSTITKITAILMITITIIVHTPVVPGLDPQSSAPDLQKLYCVESHWPTGALPRIATLCTQTNMCDSMHVQTHVLDMGYSGPTATGLGFIV